MSPLVTWNAKKPNAHNTTRTTASAIIMICSLFSGIDSIVRPVSKRWVSLTFRLLTLHPAFELALDVVEGAVAGHVGVLQFVLHGRCVRDENLVPGKADVDRVTILIPVTVMMAGELDHDVAGDDAIEEVVELPGPLPEMVGQGFRAR
jgi:hypothetical protein